MEKTSMLEMDLAQALAVEGLVKAWMQENKMYLLDGDPRILHPIAQTRLVNAIMKVVYARPVEKPAAKAKSDGKRRSGDDRDGA